ncbi:hypothetical protein RCL_jg26346.t1 [Rhizophagus clarus]|uniref:Uncharacterized protein n=1 Tax=Rhizophagus clarus TaxID=94130 RepID=A0A8H3L019_9GLOM|nr:hypothetical protein RCL_jg26346.t1 [Rhizophagus clarus]
MLAGTPGNLVLGPHYSPVRLPDGTQRNGIFKNGKNVFNTKFFIHTEDKQRKIVTYFKTCKKQLVRLTLPMSEKRDSEDERKIKVPTSRLRRTRRRKISGPNGINEESPCAWLTEAI